MGRFENKVVIVTGASRGIGAEVAVAFAKEGAKLVIHGRNEERLNKTALLCENTGVEVLKIIGELTIFEHLESIIKQTVEKFSSIDILINNAGEPNPLGPIKDIELAGYEFKFQLNVRAPVFLCKYAFPHLEKTKGCIVNVSSLSSIKVQAGLTDYGMTKAALDHFTRCFSQECAPFGIRVNSINPGAVDTGIVERFGSEEYKKVTLDWIKRTHPFGAIHPKTVAEGVLFLCSSPNITGTNLLMDSGSLHL